jgi:TM2 domain-containing membrane protein YozV
MIWLDEFRTNRAILANNRDAAANHIIGRRTEMFYNFGPGSTGNVIAAVCSVFVPGLGQLVQGRILKAAFMFVSAMALWFVLMGWLVHVWSVWDAAMYRPKWVRVVFKPNGHRHDDESFYYVQGQADSLV